MKYDLTWAELQALGTECGFDAIGSTTADAFPDMIPVLEEYAEHGLTGYENSDISLRVQPTAWFSEAQSLIAVAVAYLTQNGQQTARQHPARGLHGQMSVYAYGQDYHLLVRQRLERLHRKLEEQLQRDISAVYGVDTSPLVDRRVAQRAGIGWVGKNSMLYAGEYGSFVFLGTLAVNIAVEPAATEQVSHCGTCTQCLSACPTNALIGPGRIDATRCLSYITQMKGIIPEEFRSKLGRRVWGCDTCQWACPENREVTTSSHQEFLPQGELAYPDLVAILHLTNRQFLRQFGHTAAAWRGLSTWQRNALIALGNTKRQEALDEIIPFLQHSRRELRASAAWACSQIGGPISKQAVATVLQNEQDSDVQREMQWAVDYMS